MHAFFWEPGRAKHVFWVGASEIGFFVFFYFLPGIALTRNIKIYGPSGFGLQTHMLSWS